MSWSLQDVPDQSGKIAVVTGANSGLGFETTKALAGAGATVILGCRSAAKAEQAIAEIKLSVPQADLRFLPLDLGSLTAVRVFADAVRERFGTIDLLVNNAGIMAVPLGATQDGFERQLGTNHLGHFTLTSLLLDRLMAAPEGRVVTVSSMAHAFGTMHFDDLMGARRYERWSAYAQSKLANLLFALELDRRLRAAGSTVKSMAAHPGWSATKLQAKAPQEQGSALGVWAAKVGNGLFAQSPSQGALPQLFAATAPEAESGAFYGPDGWFALRGNPTVETPRPAARSAEDGARLWQISTELTRAAWPV